MTNTSKFIKAFRSEAPSCSLLSLTASIAFAASASAAEFPIKAPPVIPDLTWHGITLIGTIDVSGQYQYNGAPYAGNIYSPSSLIAPTNRSSQFLLAPNQSRQSYVGVKVEENLASDLNFIARAEMGFIPTTGELADGLKSVKINNGIALNQQNFNADGSRAGQILNGEAWAGFDSKQWGTVHVGRNLSVSADMLGAYDPLASFGFSLLGYVSYFSGMGSAETAIIDDSIKYLKNWGPVRIEAMYGHPNTNAKDFWQAEIGYVLPQFSIDALGGVMHDAISVSSLSSTLPGALGSNFLGARVFDASMYGVLAKYVFPVGVNGPLSTAASKFILSGGYSRVTFSNPADGGRTPGFSTIGSYQIGPTLSQNGSSGFGIVNYSYTGGDRLVDISFITGKYQYDDQLAFTLAYYRFDQNSYGHGVNSIPGITAASFSNADCSSASFLNCAGSEQVGSFRVDYQYTKNLMFYAGMAYSKVSGGLAFGYLKTYTYDPTIGLRFTF
ncbi:porin [Bradyrhizobium sp. Pear77]|uniref:porin n=1 Tax=Bradyrhizobium TaxID=374 RepID=UPI001E4D3A9D|nr:MULTISPECIES: porin [Bradyrhizobium]MCC8958126.1 porin [Bradyrhizobium altum]MCC8967165.1 porin [Bradyrhizobium oropedii]